MYKRSFFCYILFVLLLTITLNFNINNIYCTEINESEQKISENNSDLQNTNNDEEHIKKEELNRIIKELVQDLKNKIIGFDEKIELIRNTDEYINYPAIRLNVDTPLFGLNSMIDSKLKITKDVSPTDMANSYSIKTIIKNNSIRLPDSKLGSLVLSTKEVRFDDNISIGDANTSILKLIQYEKTLDNIDSFIDDQINKFFKGYIPKDKNQNIENISVRLDRLDNLMLEQDIKVLKLEILSVSEEEKSKFSEKLSIFNKISSEIKKERKEIVNMLLSYDDITDIQKRLIDVETSMSAFSKELDELLLEKKDYDILSVLTLLSRSLTLRKDNIAKYINNSVVENEIKNDNIENNQENLSTEKDDSVGDEISGFSNDNENLVEEIKVYDVISKNVLEELERYISTIDEKIKEYESKNVDKIENVDTSDNDNNVEESSSNDNDDKENEKLKQKEELLNEVLNLYKEFIAKENKFYIDNINLILTNTTNIVSDLARYTDSNLIDKMKYIYLELPDSLEKYLDETNMNLNTEIKELSTKLHEKINEFVNLYIEVNSLYEKLNVNDIKTKA